MASPDEFRSVALRFRRGDASGADVTSAFEDSTFYFVMTNEPGFEGTGTEGERFVPLYSSEAALLMAEGQRKWMAVRGGDVVHAIPPGYGIAIDLGSDAELVLPAAAIRRAGAHGSLDLRAGQHGAH